jgi:dienelactone hydrolase
MATKTSMPRPAQVRAEGALSAVLAFVAGSVALSVGLGLALPHLRAGSAGGAVVGLMALAAGVALTGVAAVVLVRRARGRWRVIVVPALLVFILVSVSAVGQAVAATHVPRTTVGATTPAHWGLKYADAEFETSDGVRLSGWYVPSTNGAAVVVLHGAGSTRTDALGQAVVLARHGYGVLLFDARGHGRSAGRAMDFGWYGDEDVSAAVSYVQARPDVDDARIGALGLSMGGEEAIGAAAGDARIRAVVAEGATNRGTADRAWLSDQYGWRGSLQEGLEWLTYGVTDLLTGADQPTSLREAAAAAAPRPILLVAGGARPDEEYAGRYIQSGSPDSVQLWVVPDAGHTQGLHVAPGQWEQRVIAFFGASLLG